MTIAGFSKSWLSSAVESGSRQDLGSIISVSSTSFSEYDPLSGSEFSSSWPEGVPSVSKSVGSSMVAPFLLRGQCNQISSSAHSSVVRRHVELFGHLVLLPATTRSW